MTDLNMTDQNMTNQSTPRRVLITGTDQHSGKTRVAVALIAALADRGHTVHAFKPVETGCADTPDPTEDGVRLARATGQVYPGHALQRLPDPVSPPLAALRASVTLTPDDWVDQIRIATSDYVLIEGTGGLLAPLAPATDALTLAERLDAAFLVVAPDDDDALNHIRLTLTAIQAAGWAVDARFQRRLLGVVLSATASQTRTGAHIAALMAWTNAPVYQVAEGEPVPAALLDRVRFP